MPHSRSAVESASAVRGYLQEVLPEARFSDISVDRNDQPLVVMRNGNVLAAFGFAGNNPKRSYDVLYGGFKTHYGNQQGRWDKFDVSFVYCLSPDSPELDLFRSQVETDVYFCRKFVVPLSSKIDVSLAPLPFLPLAPLHGRAIRPPSAQTFLRQCGVSTDLAKFIVAQGERSPERIVEDCLSDRFGEPRVLSPSAFPRVLSSDRSGSPVRLKSVEIKNFRAYRRPQSFELGRCITILYGMNGFGKTSLFDAIDFALTGGIGRINASANPHLTRTGQHLDSHGEDSYVSLGFAAEGTAHLLTRKLTDPKQASIDGETVDRKTVLQRLTGGNTPASDRVENLVSLFRATHLFSQEQQEIARDFQADCQLSAEIVSRMLAFEDYASASSKAVKVESVLQAEVARLEAEMARLNSEISNNRKELETFSSAANVQANPAALLPEVTALKEELESIGLSITSNSPDGATVRGWRGAIEARLTETDANRARLAELANDIVILPRVRKEISALQLRLQEQERGLNEIADQRKRLDPDLVSAERHAQDVESKLSTIAAQAAAVEWALSVKSMYETYAQSERDGTDGLRSVNDALAIPFQQVEGAGAALRKLELRAKENADRLSVQFRLTAQLRALLVPAAAWESNQVRLEKSGASELAMVVELEQIAGQLTRVHAELMNVQVDLKGQKGAIQRAERNQSEIRAFFLAIRQQIKTATCPLCGDDHGSIDQLQQRIDATLAAATPGSNSESSPALRIQRDALAKQRLDLIHRRTAVGNKLFALKKDKERIEKERLKFQEMAAAVGIDVTLPGQSPTQLLQLRLRSAEQELVELQKSFDVVTAELGQARQRFLEDSKAVTDKLNHKASIEGALESARRHLEELRRDKRTSYVSLDLPVSDLQEQQRRFIEELRFLREALAAAKQDLERRRSESASLQERANLHNEQVAVLRRELDAGNGMIRKTLSSLSTMGLGDDGNPEDVLRLADRTAKMLSRLQELRGRAIALEAGLDAVTTAAAMTQLQGTLKEKERLVESAEQRLKKYQRWVPYFCRMSQLLVSQQSAATARFTNEYGPRTSVIQRRLRPVYGFGDVRVDSQDGVIMVRVERKGQTLRPVDYFSQAQQLTLLLGLFLTASSAQTWSAFAPVLMDDPVTHLDDLNTYALLDLIAGLLLSESEPKQFVISTCDERLMQLARQKFRHLGQDARFYHFSAMGEEGPLVHELPNS